MIEYILQALMEFSYLGLFLLIVIENLFPPIPCEVILLLAGFLATKTNLSLLFMIIVATLGSLVGALILYYLGYFLNSFNKNRRKLKIKETDLSLANSWFQKKGYKAVFLCRFIPIVRSLISIPAGFNKMPLLIFLIYTFGGSIIWNTVLLCAGFVLGENWKLALVFLDRYKKIILILLVVLVVKKIIKKYNQNKIIVVKKI